MRKQGFRRTALFKNISTRNANCILVALMLILPIISAAQKGLADRIIIHPQEVFFSPQGGFFKDIVEVNLKHERRWTNIYYTLDGSEPTTRSKQFKKPIRLTRTTVIRAIGENGDGTLSRIEASTYFINEPETDWMVVSLAIPPEMLFDTISGLFEEGQRARGGVANYGANYWSRKEYEMNAELFDTDSTCVYRSPCGFRMFGGLSRKFPQKSISMVSRIRYGDKRIRHRLFPQINVDKFKFLILRNTGSDWGRAHGRDAIITQMAEGWNVDKQAFRPSHLYINGKYWGIYNIREKMNAYFLNTHHKKIHPDSIDLIEHQKAVRKGSISHYKDMLQFMEQSDMSQSKNYELVQTLMDVENFADYKLFQIFIDNVDGGGNTKFWRSEHLDGKWRWLLYDTDWGFGLMKSKAYKNNTLKLYLREDGPSWPNPPWATFLLRNLLENEEFEHLFVNRFCDRLNTSFRTDTMLSLINNHYEMIKPEMPRQFRRWGLSRRRWKVHYNRMWNFAEKRPDYMRSHLRKRFDTGKRVRVGVSTEGRGRVLINENLKVTYKQDFQGEYFENFPITLRAIPRLGYSFSHWEGTNSTSPFLEIDLEGKRNLGYHAVFVPVASPYKDSIVFNEVSCYNHNSSDWLEIHNMGEQKVDLTNWIIKNQKEEYVLPPSSIAANSYIVIAKDTTRFLNVYPQIRDRVIGDFDFGLNKQTDRLELYTPEGATVDTFTYNIATPGRDFTIDLKSPKLDNGDSNNWEVSIGLGTPGYHNTTYWAALTYEQQMLWMQRGLALGLFLLIGMIVYLWKWR